MSDMPSQRTLDRTLGRTARFLRAAGLQPRIFRALLRLGYRLEHHKEGWRLLTLASGFTLEALAPLPDADPLVVEAIVNLDALDAGLLQRLDGILRFNHPSQAEYVLRDLKGEEGALAVVNVKLVSERVATLRAGRTDETREQDAAAIATLTNRGLDAAYFESLAELVDKAQGAPVTGILPEPVDSDELRNRQFEAYKWWYEWSAAARTGLTNRNHLISLGLLTRGKPNNALNDNDFTEDEPIF